MQRKEHCTVADARLMQPVFPAVFSAIRSPDPCPHHFYIKSPMSISILEIELDSPVSVFGVIKDGVIKDGPINTSVSTYSSIDPPTAISQSIANSF